MLYYLGKGAEFKKEDCKEYKTLKNALAAAAKDEAFKVWDETGQVAGSLVDGDKVPEGAQQTNPDGSINTYDVSGNKTGTISAEEAAAITGNADGNKVANEAAAVAGSNDEKKPEETSNVIIPQGKMKVTVVCDGTLNLRRTPEWGNRNICGRASRGQSYYVKAIHTVENKKMVQTIDDVYLSGDTDLVQFEQL